MRIDVNLLPGTYLKARRHARWFKRCVVVGLAIVGVELCAGLALRWQGNDVRQMRASLAESETTLADLERDLSEATQRNAVTRAELSRSQELRASHHWSRLLTSLSAAAPERVVLSSISTEPKRWTSTGVRPDRPVMSKRQAKSKSGKAEEAPVVEPPIKAIVIHGYAADHDGLSELMTSFHDAGVFATLDLRDMKREMIAGLEAIRFELKAKW